LTKTDLVAGFVEFWSDLGKAQRQQVLGASFEVDDPRLDDPARAIESELDVLLSGLHARLLDRLPAERSPERRARVLQFPLELQALRSPLASFVEALCTPDAAGERPLLRGFYLTSGAQVGRPVDRVLAGMQRAFDIRGTSAKLPAGEEQSYFLSDVFRSVILPDRNLAARSAAGTQRRSKRELVLALIALGVALFLLVPVMVSYVRNAQIAGDVDAAAVTLLNVDSASVPGARTDPLEPLLDTLDRVDREAGGFSVPGWFGPRAARELRQPLWRVYIERIDAALHARVQRDLDKRASEVSKSAGRPDPTTSSPDVRSPLREDYDDIKLYATLVDPAGHVAPTWTPIHLASIWQRTLAGVDTVDESRLTRHASEYLDALEVIPALAWSTPRALQGARASLKRSDAWQLPLNWLLRHAFEVPGLVADDVVGSAQSIRYVACQAGELVPGAYTKNGLRKIEPILESPDPWPPEGLVEPWVVEDTRIPEGAERVRAQAQDEYFDEYVHAWTRLLEKCSVVQPPDPGVCKSELEALSGPSGFYESLFLQFKDNAIKYEKKDAPLSLLTTEGCSSKMPWSSKADAGPVETLTPVEKSFRPLLTFAGIAPPEPDAPKPEGLPPLQKYKQILQALIPLMETASQQRATDVEPQLVTARQGVEGLLNSVQDAPTKTSLTKLLTPPILAAKRVVLGGLSGTTADGWNKQVWPAISELVQRYPFNKGPNVRREDAANFEAFAAFFRPPDGTLWAFVKGPLFADYVTQGASGAPIAKPGYVVGGDVLTCLTAAQEITDAFFPPGEDRGTKLAILVDWSSPDITDVNFTLGSKSTPLSRGDWSPTMKWAGEGVRISYSQAGTSQQILGRGSFSLFDLFDQLGGLKPTVSRNYVARSTTLPITVKVRSEAKQDPFEPDFFARLHCPEEVHPMPKP
jgi:type VI protein secretion system component VasK